MNRIVTIVVGLALFWALFSFGARAKAPEIQADIQNRTQAALTEQGFADVIAIADGRDITLHFSNPIAQIDAKRESEAVDHGDAWVPADHALQTLLDQVMAADPSITVSEPSDRKGIRINLLDEVTG